MCSARFGGVNFRVQSTSHSRFPLPVTVPSAPIVMKPRPIVPILTALLFVLPAAAATDSGSRLYEVTTETGMPHLEENLRYATRIERSCVNPRQLMKAFPMLRDVSLQDCELVETDEATQDILLYRLQCSGGHGTMGSARWDFGSTTITGTLSVRLGGKNMTFYQRITAR